MSISAMKQALRALERADKISGYANNQMAIYALSQAIAEAEKPAHTDHPSRHWDRTCPACVYESDISQERVDETAKQRHEWVEMQCPCGHKMYVKHTGSEWVGLEEEEILKCFDSVALGQVEGACVIDKHVNIFNAIRAIEAKLKEKNT